MPIRRILLIASVAFLAVSIAVASLGLTAWSDPQGKRAPVKPTGPAQDATARAKAVLASRLGVSADQVAVESVQEHTWSDTSLDLPEPDMMYAQVLTDGHIVTLSHDGRTYAYHVAGETVVYADPDDTAPGAPADPGDDPAEKAKAVLASRLGVSADQIAVDSVQEHTWSDTSLGLPEPDMMYAQVLTDGHIVTLSHGGRTYVYHVAGETVKLNPAGN
jgi:hypothetical protein